MYFFKGLLIQLRRITESDCKILFEEQKDSDSVRLFEPGIENIETEAFFQKLKDRKYFFAIENETGSFVGTIHFNDTDAKNGVFDMGIKILQQYQQKGYAKDAYRVMLRYGFHELRFHKANADLLSINHASAKLHESLGFIKEGVRRKTVYTNGTYHDQLLYGLTREEFEVHNSDWLTQLNS